MFKKTLAVCAASTVAVISLGVSQAHAVTTSNCYAYPPTKLTTLLVRGDLYLQACVWVNGTTVKPFVRVTSNGYHHVQYKGWLNVNDTHFDEFHGERSGQGWSQDFYGTPVTVALTGATYAQGQAGIYVDDIFYVQIFSQSIYVG